MKVPKKKNSPSNLIRQVREQRANHLLSVVKADLVNPQHYQGAGGMQVLDVLKAFLSPEEFKGFLKGNCLKYQLRCEKKGGTTDLSKSEWYQKELAKVLNANSREQI
jgi:hypothetical protein